MRLSRAAGYGIHAVVYIARQSQGERILARSIAKDYKLPVESLQKILQQLVRAQVLRSTRGPAGGFRLARKAQRIALADIIVAADGPIMAQLEFDDEIGERKIKQTVNKLCKQSAKQIKEVFGSVSVADLL